MTKDSDRESASPELSESLGRAIGDRYLTYALSTIMNRALPDARDGLKPVHRRILYAMRELRLGSTGGFRKSAKISGDVMGNYHPHGDAAIYDAMARLAQDFTIRYPLVDGQGNFGNIDGDNPAASRYTEARMTAAAEALLAGLDEDAVDFRPNYDGTLSEPEVLPAAFPNLLANGSSGIAVGMATNIPPHNLTELIDACLHLIRTPDARDDTLLNYVKGPDFPTGGVIVESPESMAEAYRTGRGGFRTRARWHPEDLGRGQWQIVVTEIPYQVQKSKLVERIAELVQSKKLPILADVRDESADDVRLVLEPRSRTVDPDLLMGTLFRQSDLETRFALNMNVLIDGRTPKVCSLKEVLRAFLDHRQQVLLRRKRHRLGRIDHRLEVLEGFILAFLNLDRVIEIIRYDEGPKPALMRQDWTEVPPRAEDEAGYVSPPRATPQGRSHHTPHHCVSGERSEGSDRLELYRGRGPGRPQQPQQSFTDLRLSGPSGREPDRHEQDRRTVRRVHGTPRGPADRRASPCGGAGPSAPPSGRWSRCRGPSEGPAGPRRPPGRRDPNRGPGRPPSGHCWRHRGPARPCWPRAPMPGRRNRRCSWP